MTDSDIEWVNPGDAIETGTRQGRRGFEEAESAFRRAYRSIRIEVERRVEFGGRVGLIAEALFEGRGSGIEVRQRMGMLFTIREGRLARFEWSNDPEGLLASVESEEDAEA
ncbi:MAG: nuclear transport factor 2 family protein [Solirubrobacterales bacterium]